VENSTSSDKLRLYSKKNLFKKSGSIHTSLAAWSNGTQITLMGMNRDIDREKQLLEAFCRSVRQEVRLNHRSLGGQPFLSGQMAVIELSPSKSSSVSFGQVGIPIIGRTCHFRFLDQGIPWHHFSLPPQKGFIFDAAVETTGGMTKDLVDYLVQYAHRLYQWLGQRYTTAEPVHRDRIEELLFTHCRLTNDDSLILQFAPFSLFNSRRSLSLRQVKEKANRGLLYAVPEHKDRLRYNTAQKTVLSLTREQADLLINHLNIPITFLNPVSHRVNPIPAVWDALKRRFKRFILSLLPTPKKILKANQLTKGQQLFTIALTKYLVGHGEFSLFHRPGVQVLLIPSRGPFPSVTLKKNKKQLLIRRDHPLVQKAIRAVQSNPRDIELFVPLLI
jgi:transposase